MLTETLVCRIITFYSVHFNIVMTFFLTKRRLIGVKRAKRLSIYLIVAVFSPLPPPLYSTYTLHMNDWDLVPFK